jgi:hypothetical protein
MIEWEDSNFEHGWLSIDQVSGILITTRTVGFAIFEDATRISVSQNKSDLDTYMGIMTIPKSCIKSIKELRIK